jgi:hypothetical protein
MIMTILFLIVYGYIILSSGRNLFFFFVRYGALRSPLPGIPFNIAAYRRAFGDIAELNERRRNGETSIRPWFLEQAARHKSAIVQIFLGPFARPAVLLSDYREVYDILTHRDADFKRGKKVDVFKGVLPHAFVSMESFDPRFNETRNLMNDLMAPSFLHKVSTTNTPNERNLERLLTASRFRHLGYTGPLVAW